MARKYYELHYRTPNVNRLLDSIFEILRANAERCAEAYCILRTGISGDVFRRLPEEGQKKLSRARIDVVRRILEVARRNAVNAILCVGDIFDDPDPEPDFWQGLVKSIPDPRRCASATVSHSRQSRSVYAGIGVVAGTSLPRRVASTGCTWWTVMTSSYEISPAAVLYARPCRSKAGGE